MEVVTTCPKCSCSYGWNMGGVETTPDGGTRPASAPNCPKCGYVSPTGGPLRSHAMRNDADKLLALLQPRLGNLFGLLRPNINERNAGGFTPLINAAQYGSKDCVAILLDHGADINAKTNGGQTALNLAEEYGHPAVAELLKSRGAEA